MMNRKSLALYKKRVDDRGFTTVRKRTTDGTIFFLLKAKKGKEWRIETVKDYEVAGVAHATICMRFFSPEEAVALLTLLNTHPRLGTFADTRLSPANAARVARDFIKAIEPHIPKKQATKPVGQLNAMKS